MEDEFREPTAKELVQRHRIASLTGIGLISSKRPSLSVSFFKGINCNKMAFFNYILFQSKFYESNNI